MMCSILAFKLSNLVSLNRFLRKDDSRIGIMLMVRRGFRLSIWMFVVLLGALMLVVGPTSAIFLHNSNPNVHAVASSQPPENQLYLSPQIAGPFALSILGLMGIIKGYFEIQRNSKHIEKSAWFTSSHQHEKC